MQLVQDLTGTPKETLESPGYMNRHIRSYCQFLDSQREDRTALKRCIYYGVKLIVSSRPERYEIDGLRGRYNLITQIEDLMGLLTPSELLEVFPVAKSYKGKRKGQKDYFYTMDKLKSCGLHRQLKNTAQAILWDYQNADILLFVIEDIRATDALRRHKGMPSMFLELDSHCLRKAQEVLAKYKGQVIPIDPRSERMKLDEYLKVALKLTEDLPGGGKTHHA